MVGFSRRRTAANALTFTRTMREIAVAESAEWKIPALDFAGVPTGIRARLVAGIAPTINCSRQQKTGRGPGRRWRGARAFALFQRRLQAAKVGGR